MGVSIIAKENLYDTLELEKTEDEKDIKMAYVRMLRKYPPDKAPDEFKKIRAAYETLIDSISRAEYNALYNYENEIKVYSKKAKEAFNRGDYKTAIIEYKKILQIEPTLAFAKNGLGLALEYNQQYDEALSQFKELTELNPNNSSYFSNLGFVYKEKSCYEEAEKAWLRANQLDGDKEEIIVELTDLYIDRKQHNRAIEFLYNNIVKNRAEDFKNFTYYYHMVRIYALVRSAANVEIIIEKIKETMLKSKDNKEYVAWKLGELANALYMSGNYDMAEKIAKNSLEIGAGDVRLKAVYEKIIEYKKNHKLLNKLKNDSLVIDSLRRLILLSITQNISKEVRDKYYADIMKEVEAESYSNIINSINNIKRNYFELYKSKEELLDSINDKAIEKKREEAFNRKYNKKFSEKVKARVSKYIRPAMKWTTVIIFTLVGGIVNFGIGNIVGGLIGYIIASKVISL